MTYQQRVRAWVVDCFGLTIADDRAERSFRFLEEALELAQSVGATREQADRLVDYVYGRPVGEPAQEVGGVMVTLAALVSVVGLDMHVEAERELERISVPDVREKIRRKQASKPVVVVGSPDAVLPGPTGASPQAYTSANVRALTVHICEDCLNLRGEMCNEPCCRFCRRTMAEVAEYLDVLLIRPRIDGVSVLVDEGTPLPPVSPVEPTPEPETCASECNPYMSRCGAKFCTFEDMAAHEQECKRLVPSEETPR